MRFTLCQIAFEEALRTVGRALTARSTGPLLSGVYLKAEGQELHLRATDLELDISLVVPAAVAAPGEIVLPGRYLIELVRRLPPGEVTVSLNPQNQTVKVWWEESEAVVHGFETEQFPAPGSLHLGKPLVSIGYDSLRTLLRETLFAVAQQDESFPSLTGIRLTVEGGRAIAMATNRVVLAYSEADVDNPSDTSFSVILPGRSLQELSRLLTSCPQTSFQITTNHRLLRFELGALTLASRLLGGRYPDFRHKLPTHYPSVVSVDRERLTLACERVAVAAQMGAVQVDAGSEGLHLISRTPEVGEVVDRLDARLEGPAFTVSIDVLNVINGLRSITSEQVILEFPGGGQAVRFRCGPSANSYFSVLPLQRSRVETTMTPPALPDD